MSNKIPLIVVTGPTASGKTKLSIDLASRLGGEIIGADSMQIYKGMTVGTAKPTLSEMRGVPHHLIDFLDPGEKFSVADYVRLAKNVITDIISRGKLPVLAGGTGLYITSLVDNISFEGVESQDSVRLELKALAAEKGAEYLHEQLRLCDPAIAAKLHPNNLGRVIRALEVFRLTGVPMSEMQKKSRENPSEYDLCMLGLAYKDRDKLYGRINLRVDLMLRDGLLDEAKALLDSGHMETASQAIGYKELSGYLYGTESIDTEVETIKRSTRRYAKRQMTWLKRDDRIRWLYADEYPDYSELLSAALTITDKFLGDCGWEDLPKK